MSDAEKKQKVRQIAKALQDGQFDLDNAVAAIMLAVRKPTHQAEAKPVDGDIDEALVEMYLGVNSLSHLSSAGFKKTLEAPAIIKAKAAISAHLQAAVRAARLDEHDKVTEKYIAMIEGRKDQLEEQLHG